MKIIILSIVLLSVLFSVINAHAFELFSKSDTVTGSKANSHIIEHHHKAQCNNDGVPVLDNYTGEWQNDGTPVETEYNDYLEDLTWYAVQNPGHCNIVPETLGG
jgi:hypothetical protein